jgi:hypothetical protein
MLKIILLIMLLIYNIFKLKDALYNLQINNYNNKKYHRWLKSNFLTIYKKTDFLIFFIILSLILIVRIEVKIMVLVVFALFLIINNLIKMIKSYKTQKIAINMRSKFIAVLIGTLMAILVLFTFISQRPYNYLLLMSLMNIFLYYLVALFNVKFKVSKKP